MPAIISMLRAVNVGGHNKISMEALRALYESLALHDPQTYVQSCNVVFRSDAKNLKALAEKIEKAIEKKFGFRPTVILRTKSEMKAAMEKNPFAGRPEVAPNKLLVTFLAQKPAAEALVLAQKIKADPEEMHILGREVYIYFPNGMGRPKLSWPQVERALKTTGTGRNWNTVTKLLEMAQKLEG